jgi:hypothetical protein
MTEINKGGVKTEEGKAISKMNALKHGLLSREVLLEGDDQNQFQLLRTKLNNELIPVGMFEELLVDRIVSGFWRLKRALNVEKNTMDWYISDKEMIVLMHESEEQTNRKQIKNTLSNETIENILRYEITIERGIFRALHELERLQAKRNGKEVELPSVLDISVGGSFGKNDTD